MAHRIKLPQSAPQWTTSVPVLDRRAEFAKAAMQGLVASWDSADKEAAGRMKMLPAQVAAMFARDAVEIADALISALDQKASADE